MPSTRARLEKREDEERYLLVCRFASSSLLGLHIALVASWSLVSVFCCVFITPFFWKTNNYFDIIQYEFCGQKRT